MKYKAVNKTRGTELTFLNLRSAQDYRDANEYEDVAVWQLDPENGNCIFVIAESVGHTKALEREAQLKDLKERFSEVKEQLESWIDNERTPTEAMLKEEWMYLKGALELIDRIK